MLAVGGASLVACAGQGVQVPKSKPHGVAELRIEHAPGKSKKDDNWVSDVAVIDGVMLELDDQQGATKIRLSPGVHDVELRSSKVELRNDVVRRPVGRPCYQDRLACTQPPFTEDQLELVPTELPGCSTHAQVHVSEGETVRETMLVDADGVCHRETDGSEPGQTESSEPG